jgi:hypothetical protein
MPSYGVVPDGGGLLLFGAGFAFSAGGFGFSAGLDVLEPLVPLDEPVELGSEAGLVVGETGVVVEAVEGCSLLRSAVRGAAP